MTWRKDYADITQTLAQRAVELKKLAENLEFNSTNSENINHPDIQTLSENDGSQKKD